jgi:hypothetical protein
MELGNRTYSALEIDSILDSSVNGNALISLSQQLISAKMNVLQGANSSQIASDISLAKSLIANLIVPPVGSSVVRSNTSLGQQMDQVKTNLDNFNNGVLNVPHCK